MPTFDKNVFVNCPFDDDYVALLRPLLFTLVYLKFNPKIANQKTDSAEIRVSKIMEYIASSRFAVHDLSRLRSTAKDEYFRLNMPFELGLDIGCRQFGSGDSGKKRCLVLEAERYAYQAALSDISGQDIKVHANKPVQIVGQVREWVASLRRTPQPGATKIWNAFNDFMSANYDEMLARGFSPKDARNASTTEIIPRMKVWIRKNR